MSRPVGFVLLTHAQPAQVSRLCWRLTALFDAPPIVCHHDHSKSTLRGDALPPNVRMVHPHLTTGWAEFSVVEATVRAFDLMYSDAPGPDWCVVLSGSDHPVSAPDRVLEDLYAGDYDAHIRHEVIDASAMDDKSGRPLTAPGEHIISRALSFGRFCTVPVPWLTPSLRPTTRVLYSPRWTRLFVPWSSTFRCYAGSQWFCANARAVQYIRRYHREQPRLAHFYRKRRFTEESYFQTILANNPAFRLHNENWRYTDWSIGGEHPRILTAADVPSVLASGRHFARKIDMDRDPAVLDMFDAATDAALAGRHEL